jgi:LmbE family N-acetylglucosaminyl deacetylase
LNVLVIAPHPDDEAIGCGGSIGVHVDRSDRVVAVFLTSGELGLKDLPREQAWQQRETEAQAAAEVLGLSDLIFLRHRDWFIEDSVEETARSLQPIFRRESPKIVYLPHPGEWHPDHKVSLSVVRAALSEQACSPPILRCYEFWTPLVQYNYVENIPHTMARKLEAVRCYQSQLAQYRYDLAVQGLNQYRGVTAAKSRFAEVFDDIQPSASLVQIP